MPHDAPYAGGYHPYKSFGGIREEKERARFAEFPRQGAYRRPYGLDHTGQPYFDLGSPWIKGWIEGGRHSITVYPSLSNGAAYVDATTGDLVVRG